MPKDIEELRWVRAFSSTLIPKYLVEQVRDRNFSVEDFYKYNELNLTYESDTGTALSPFNHIYVMANSENQVKGFLWFVIDVLTRDITINTFSVDENYWFNGKAVAKLAEHMKNLMVKLDIKKTYWMTRYPKHSQRHGFKRSKDILMEYVREEEDGKKGKRHNDGVDQAQEKHQHVDAGATTIAESAIRSAGA